MLSFQGPVQALRPFGGRYAKSLALRCELEMSYLGHTGATQVLQSSTSIDPVPKWLLAD
jgi:hypothetical protein